MTNISSNMKMVTVVSIVAVVIGLVSWFFMLNGGASAVGFNDRSPWGLLIAAFLFFEAVASGALFAGALLKNKSLLALGLGAAAAAGFAIVADLGAPFAIWALIFTPNIHAPMMLDVWFLTLNMVFGALMFFNISTNITRNVLLVVSVLLPVGTAWMITSLPGAPGWMSSIEIPLLLIEVAIVGCAVAYVLDKTEVIKTPFIIALGSFLVISVAEHLKFVYALPASNESIFFAAFDSLYQIVYWGMIAICILLPLVMLITKKGTPAIIATLSFVGVFVSKALLIEKGNLLPYEHFGNAFVSNELMFNNNIISIPPTSTLEVLVILGSFGLMCVVAMFLTAIPQRKSA
ncbi:MAG: hypothetical protein ACJAWW_001481 [Sulfurimonas sp.]|jgi:hypothetical protein